MQTSLASSSDHSEKPWALVIAAVVLTLLLFTGYNYLQQSSNENKTLKIENSGGKNAKHVNQKTKERAEQEYQKVNDELAKLRAKTPKTKEDVKQVD